jgi:Nucleotidyl transferase AbiEii toxin, Type IV TA system
MRSSVLATRNAATSSSQRLAGWARLSRTSKRIFDPDEADPDRQTFLLWYPAVTARPDDYVRSAVKIEGGAKSALDPHVSATLKPYVSDDLPGSDLAVLNVTTVDPSRTFWDKIVILHGLRRWHDRRAELRHGGQRVSRHHYDVYRLLQAAGSKEWRKDRRLAGDCARHARMFFYSADLGLDQAVPGTFTLKPTAAMRDALVHDYAAMRGMIFGQAPEFDAVVAEIASLEAHLNAPAVVS